MKNLSKLNLIHIYAKVNKLIKLMSIDCLSPCIPTSSLKGPKKMLDRINIYN